MNKIALSRIINNILIFLLIFALLPLQVFSQEGDTSNIVFTDSGITVTDDVYMDPDITVIESVYNGETDSTQKYLVQLKQGVSLDQFLSQNVSQQSNSLFNNEKSIKSDKKIRPFKSVKGFSAYLTNDELLQLKNNPQVVHVELDHPVDLISESANVSIVEEVYGIKDSSQTIPWGMHSTGAYLALNNGSYTHSIKVAVLDTGISPHSDLSLSGGISFVENVISYEDDHGHGTHIAGTIAANNNHFGVVGIAPSSEIYAVKVLDASGKGTYSSVIAGIDWAIANNIDVISMSFGGSEPSEILHEAIQAARSHGIVVIAAAGNKGFGTDTVLYPAQYSEVVAVGAVNPDHKRAGYSSVGPAIDIVAPGTNVLSTTLSGHYGMLSGTSMAAAHVTGAVSLLWSQQPALSPNELTQLLFDNATPIGVPSEYGHGLLNIAKAIGIYDGPIAPLDEFRTWEAPVFSNTKSPIDGVTIASYDKVGDHQVIAPGQSATVSLKLEGNLNGTNPHEQIIIMVYPQSDPTNLIDVAIINNPQLHTPISFTWVTTPLTPAGTYIIKYDYDLPPGVPDYDDIFTIYVQQPTVNDTYEPNDSTGSAYHVVPGDYVSYISSATDKDYYYYYPQNAGQLTVQLSVPNSVDYDLRIYDGNENVIGSSSRPTGDDELISIPVQAFHDYYIVVYGYSGAYSSVPYQLTVSFDASSIPSPPSGLQATVQHNTAIIQWNPVNGATSYQVTLDGIVLGSTTNEQYTISNLSSLTYYEIGVASRNNAGTSAYASIEIKTTAPSLQLNQSVDISGIASEYYMFTPNQTGSYRFTTSPYGGNGPSNDTILSLYANVNEAPLISNDDADSTTAFSEITSILQGGITYYIRISTYDNTNVHARLRATAETSTIPILNLNNPVDIDSPGGEDTVFAFIPAITGKYEFYTSYYNDSILSGENDTLIHVFHQSDLVHTVTNGYNDDVNASSLFSKVDVHLSAGHTYYIKVSGYAGKSVYARLYAQLGQAIHFENIQNKVAVNVNLDVQQDAYYSFTPTINGNYRLFTSPRQGVGGRNDTEMYLYTDSSLTNLIKYNDDVVGRQPYGALYSKIEHTLTAGQTYYVVIKSYDRTYAQVNFSIEDAFHTTPQSAIQATINGVYGSINDSTHYSYDISSMYDIDYYRIQISEAGYVQVRTNHNSVAIEDSTGLVLGYFHNDIDGSLHISTPGSYYLRVQYFEQSLDLDSLASSIQFSAYSYVIDPSFHTVQYENGSGMSILSNSSAKVLDATPGNNGSVMISYTVKNNHSNAVIQIYSTSKGILVYEEELGNLASNQSYNFTWNGEYNGLSEELGIYSEDEDYYYARNGFYTILIVSRDYAWYEFWNSEKVYVFDDVQVFNDPFAEINLVPLPPDTLPNGSLITGSNRNKCQECYNYFHNYIYDLNSPGHYDAQREDWFRTTYGLNGIETFWGNLGYDEDLSPADNLLRFSNAVSLIPVVGAVGDGTSAFMYAIRGDYANMGWSLLGIIPGFTEVKVGSRLIKAVTATPFKKVIVDCFCFAAGSEVQTIGGLRPIESIQVGDLVLSKNTDTGEVAYKEVEEVYSREVYTTYTIVVGDERLVVTEDHPFWVKERGWVITSDLSVGDELETSTGLVTTIDDIQVQIETIQVYNFAVAEFHTYFVSGLNILTHNLDCLTPAAYSNIGQFMQASTQSLANNLSRVIPKPSNISNVTRWDAHHIVPKGKFATRDPKVRNDIEFIQGKLEEFNIDINSPANGMWLPVDPGKIKTTIELEDKTKYVVATHNGGHSNSYISYVREQLESAESQEHVLDALQQIRTKLLTAQISLGKAD